MAARYELLAQWVEQNDWHLGAELGVFSGRTHHYLLDHCPALALVGVDVWDLPGFAEGPTKSGEKCHCRYCDETRADRRAKSVAAMKNEVLASKRRYNSRSIIYVEPTSDVAQKIKDETFDFIFVDGDHSTEGVCADIVAWKPKLRPGGWLIGHDWNMQSVREGVRRALGPVKPEQHDDHVWVIRC